MHVSARSFRSSFWLSAYFCLVVAWRVPAGQLGSSEGRLEWHWPSRSASSYAGAMGNCLSDKSSAGAAQKKGPRLRGDSIDEAKPKVCMVRAQPRLRGCLASSSTATLLALRATLGYRAALSYLTALVDRPCTSEAGQVANTATVLPSVSSWLVLVF